MEVTLARFRRNDTFTVNISNTINPATIQSVLASAVKENVSSLNDVKFYCYTPAKVPADLPHEEITTWSSDHFVKKTTYEDHSIIETTFNGQTTTKRQEYKRLGSYACCGADRLMQSVLSGKIIFYRSA